MKAGSLAKTLKQLSNPLQMTCHSLGQMASAPVRIEVHAEHVRGVGAHEAQELPCARPPAQAETPRCPLKPASDT